MSTYRVLSAVLSHRHVRNAGGDYDLLGAGFSSLESTFPAAGPLSAAVTFMRVDGQPLTPGETASITVTMRYPDGSSAVMGELTFIEADNSFVIRPLALMLVVQLQLHIREPGRHDVEVSMSDAEAPLTLPVVVKPFGMT